MRSPVDSYLNSLTLNSQRVMLSNIKTLAIALGWLPKSAAIEHVFKIPAARWSKLTPGALEAAIGLLETEEIDEKDREKRRSPKTLNGYLRAARGVARSAWLDNQLDIDTYRRICKVKPRRGDRESRGRMVEHDELKRLLDHCTADDSPAGVRDKALILIARSGGLRRSELASIRVEDLNMKEQSIHVCGKNNKHATVYLPKQTWEALSEWLVHRGPQQGALFTRIRRHGWITEERLTDSGVYDIIKRRTLKAGVGDRTPHDFRRTFITSLLNEGYDIGSVADAARHSTVDTTRIYDQAREERKKKIGRDQKIVEP